jgi:hypothetical protein
MPDTPVRTAHPAELVERVWSRPDLPELELVAERDGHGRFLYTWEETA